MRAAASSHPPRAGVVRIYNCLTPQTSFLEDVTAGLSAPQKAIPPKYFYDARGSKLFEAICELPEYYLTRTEMAIMRAHVPEIARLLGPDVELVEFGSGASVKTRLLIEALDPALYVPVDIAEDALREAAAALAERFPALHISGVVADFARRFALPEFVGVKVRRRAVYFPGSTIGNFTRSQALEFLRSVHALLRPGGMLVIGVDLKKDRAVLEAAYDDAAGVTAEFNLNLLHRVNRELEGDFEVGRFRHRAFYVPEAGQIEMHLESLYAQIVHVGGRRFDFRPGETIHTEISCKYDLPEFEALARAARFHAEKVWTDDRSWFAVFALMAV